MHRLVRLVLLVLITGALAACTQLSQMQHKQTQAKQLDPAVGSILELLKPLSVPKGQVKVWFDPAFNQVPDVSLASLFKSNRLRDGVKCGVRLASSAESEGSGPVIEAGEFVVDRVSRFSDPVGIDPRTVSLHDGFSDDVTLSYQIAVRSKTQPQVSSFFCSQRHASLARNTAYPSAAQLREQAGGALVWPQQTVR